jgi:hypothetical protein
VLCGKYLREHPLKDRTVIIAALLIIVVGTAIAVYVGTSSKPTVTGSWQTEATISNKGTLYTDPFDMDHPWRIHWTMDQNPSNNFLVSVHMKNGTRDSIVTDTYAGDTNSTSGILPVSYTGNFVIYVETADDTAWTLQIQQFVKTT